MGGSGLDRTDDFQKFCRLGLDRIQFYWIRTGLGLKNFPVHSSLATHSVFPLNLAFFDLTSVLVFFHGYSI